VDRDAPVAHDVDRRRGELVHPHEPLQRDERLDALARAVAERDRVRVQLGVADQALVAQRGDHALLRLVDAQARVLGAGGRGHAAVLADDADLLEAVAAPDLEVVRVVARRDLQGA